MGLVHVVALFGTMALTPKFKVELALLFLSHSQIMLTSMPTLRATLLSLILGVLFLPGVLFSVLLIPWIRTAGRLADHLGRRAARWLGEEIPLRIVSSRLDWPQLLHLCVQLLVGFFCCALWAFVSTAFVVLCAAPFLSDAITFGSWSSRNPPTVFALSWLLAACCAALLIGCGRGLASISVSLSRTILRPSAEDLETSRNVLIDAFSGERRRIERELHDGPQQYLTALKLNLATAKLQKDPALVQESIAAAEHNASQALAAFRTVIRGIAPQVLFDQGLLAATEELLAHSGMDTSLRVEGSPQSLKESTALLAYHGVAEGLTNAAKHGKATGVNVTIRFGRSGGILIEDNGTTCTESTLDSGEGTGIAGLRERAVAIGGTVELRQHTEHGATLELRLPMTEKNA